MQNDTVENVNAIRIMKKHIRQFGVNLPNFSVFKNRKNVNVIHIQMKQKRKEHEIIAFVH